MKNKAEALNITAEEYHNSFGTSDDADVGFEGSDIEVQQIDSDEELEEEAEESNNESNNEGDVADAIDKETAWSNELSDFVFSQFNSQCGIKVPPESKSDFFFNLIFSDELIDLIVSETNRYAQQKLAGNNTPLVNWHDVTRQELKASLGICLVMGINNLPQLTMYWSSDPLIGNTGIQNIMTKKNWRYLASICTSQIWKQSQSVAKRISTTSMRLAHFFQVFWRTLRKPTNHPKISPSMRGWLLLKAA